MSEHQLNPAGGSVLELRRVVHGYRQGSSRLKVLNGAWLTLWPGEVVALVGPSGAGKSTLLHIAGLLERPEEGEIVIDGRELARAGEGERTRTRRLEIGFVYQFHHLLPEFSALENVAMPQLIAGGTKQEANERALDLLGRLGLAERTAHRPSELSGGEQQRVAIARALANAPRILLADEPTGNLDPKTAERVHEEFVELVRSQKLAVLIATHNLELARGLDRIVRLENGTLVAGR